MRYSGSPAVVRAVIYDELDRWNPDFREKRGENAVLNLNDFAKEVHRVAVEHGWYDGQETTGTDEIIALIHSEWSEALEEYRAGRPDVYFLCCDATKAEDEVCGSGISNVCTKVDWTCSYKGNKPEGIMIELIDGCIRIMDFMGFKGWIAPDFTDTTEKLIAAAKNADYGIFVKRPEKYSLPELVRWLHWYTAEYDMDEDMNDPMLILLEAVGIVFLWIEAHDMNPEELMLTKHEYNKTRPYKHGGKRI